MSEVDDKPNAANHGSLRKGLYIGGSLTAIALASLGTWYYVLHGEARLGPAILLDLIGGVQLLWMAPAVMLFGVKRQGETVKGIAIAAGLVLLLNAACVALVFAGARFLEL